MTDQTYAPGANYVLPRNQAELNRLGLKGDEALFELTVFMLLG